MDPFEIFNSDADLRTLLDLRVVHADGTEESIGPGPVVLVNGANIDFQLDDERDDISLTAAPGVGNQDPYFTQKLTAIRSLTDANTGGNPIVGPFLDPATDTVPEGPSWIFTRDSLWIGSVNDVRAEPLTGVFFIGVDPCAVVGEFPDNDGFADELPSTLKIFDICIPCVDCLQYQKISDYIIRINAFYQYILDLVLNENAAPEHPDGGTPITFYGLLPQFTATRRYWDYLVHNAAVKFSAASMGQSLTAVVFYRNISANTVPQIDIDIEFEFLRDTGTGFVPVVLGLSSSTIDVRELARENAPNQATFNSSPVYGSTTIDVSFQTPGTLASGEQTFADVALLFRSFNFLDDRERYAVRATASISPTHLSGSPITKEQLIFFVPPGSSSSSA
jgi:hypothetical protein